MRPLKAATTWAGQHTPLFYRYDVKKLIYYLQIDAFMQGVKYARRKKATK